MCYDIKTSLETQLKRARRNNDLIAIEEIVEKLAPLTDLPLHHATGFTHPDVLIYTNADPFFPKVATWGLVPHWVSSVPQQRKIWNNTLNARGETILEKPAFRDAAHHHRCIVYVDGFYEHHHHHNATYPFFIQQKNKQPLALAGLWSEWIHPEHGGKLVSFAIVTTVGNSLMAKIHNNPALSGPRMPLLLSEDQEALWLAEGPDAENHLSQLLMGVADVDLMAHTVGKLRGKAYEGNVPSVSDVFHYQELALFESML